MCYIQHPDTELHMPRGEKLSMFQTTNFKKQIYRAVDPKDAFKSLFHRGKVPVRGSIGVFYRGWSISELILDARFFKVGFIV